MTRPRQIIALGGGGFSMTPDNLRLDDHVLAATGVEHPRVCFVPTASGDSADYLVRFYDAFARKAEARHLALFRRTIRDLRRFLLDHDVIYVGGGSTPNLLAVWRAHGVDAIMREAHDAGVVLAGISAGAMCWFEHGLSDSLGPGMNPLHGGLGLLPGTMCPHYDGEPARRPALADAVARGALPAGWAIDDDAALCFVDGELHEVVSSRAAARAWRIEPDAADGIAHHELAVRVLRLIMGRPLVVFDLDETLLHSSEVALAHGPGLAIWPWQVYPRPHLSELLGTVAACFDVAVWSSASPRYVAILTAELIAPHVTPLFAWSRSRCTERRDFATDEYVPTKPLVKLRRRGFDLRRVLIIEDDPRKVAASYGNAVYVRPFLGDPADDELPHLGSYLVTLADAPNVRAIEKRGWRRRA